LTDRGRLATVIDGDNIRQGLNRDLGFSAEDRGENVRRTAECAKLLAEAGMIVIVALISPLTAQRAAARRIIGADFAEVHVAADLGICEARDPKGLYRKARQDQLRGFTGISSPYEAPVAPELRLDTGALGLVESTAALVEHAEAQFVRSRDAQADDRLSA
jgi:adenylyl-sulfate kinase